jgi:hypothetical protein
VVPSAGLPIGLLLGWLLLALAGSGGRVAAALLPLYYLADSTITLLRRAINREPVWQAHRSHFYQRATDRGFSVMEIVARVRCQLGTLLSRCRYPTFFELPCRNWRIDLRHSFGCVAACRILEWQAMIQRQLPCMRCRPVISLALAYFCRLESKP